MTTGDQEVRRFLQETEEIRSFTRDGGGQEFLDRREEIRKLLKTGEAEVRCESQDLI